MDVTQYKINIIITIIIIIINGCKCLWGLFPHISGANLYVPKPFTPTRPEMLTVVSLYHVSAAMQLRTFSATRELCFSIL